MNLDQGKMTSIVFSAAGIILGYAAFFISRMTGFPAYNAIVLAFSILAIKFAMEKALKISQPGKWWLSNGIFLCILFWFVIWTVMFNTTP